MVAIVRKFVKIQLMRKFSFVCLLVFFLLLQSQSNAQCSLCTKTAQQLGTKPAQGMNTGIIYLMFAPFGIMGYIGYRWWKSNKEEEINN
jgi:hypothetical protein